MQTTTVDLEAAFVQAALDALHRDCKLGDAISLAYGKCESTAGVIDLIFPLITKKLRIDYILMYSIESNPRTLLQFLRQVESRLARNETGRPRRSRPRCGAWPIRRTASAGRVRSAC